MLVVDAGPLVAASFTRDRNHDRCIALLSSVPEPIVVPVLVVAEVAHLLSVRAGPHVERLFGRALHDGELEVEAVDPTDWQRIDELLEKYADLPLGIVDASIVAACERLGATTLATLDRRHFGVVRPRHCDALELLPD